MSLTDWLRGFRHRCPACDACREIIRAKEAENARLYSLLERVVLVPVAPRRHAPTQPASAIPEVADVPSRPAERTPREERERHEDPVVAAGRERGQTAVRVPSAAA